MTRHATTTADALSLPGRWAERALCAQADPDTAAVRELCDQVKADERLVPLLLPVGGGLLTAVKQGP